MYRIAKHMLLSCISTVISTTPCELRLFYDPFFIRYFAEKRVRCWQCIVKYIHEHFSKRSTHILVYHDLPEAQIIVNKSEMFEAKLTDVTRLELFVSRVS
ncbi:hypothetical protein P5V15_009589 [Pogonomyrmex californicus]